MKTIEIDEELYQYIAGQTRHIGEDASSILRRLLNINLHLLSQPGKKINQKTIILYSLIY